jgi:GNAT superfamily N-acetyltransferase
MTPHLRRACVADTQTVVRILIESKAASFPDTIDAHDRDVAFWTRRWSGYIASGSRAQQSRGDGWVFLAEIDGLPVGYIAYHHTTRHGTDAELQSLYVLQPWQRHGVGTHLLGTVAHRLHADGSRTMCVGFDAASPYTQFYWKHGAIQIEPDSPWAIWPDLGALAAQLPRPSDELLAELRQTPKSQLRRSRVGRNGLGDSHGAEDHWRAGGDHPLCER